MKAYQFTLIVDGPDLQEEAHLALLDGAGCDDATVGRIGAVQYLDFERVADSFADAVFSATEAIESSGLDLCVVRLEPDDLLTMADIAARTNRTRESVRLLSCGERGPGGFPAPATHFRSRRRMWRWQEVSVWFAEALAEPPDSDALPDADFVTAFNASLSWRRVDARLSDQDRHRLRTLVG